jgi:16S rRNA (cytosine967-C5)-methyltransferase
VSVSPARRAAFDTVLRVFEDDAYADRAFPAAAAGLDARDRALAQRLAFGTIQRIRTLDHGIETLGRRPVAKLDAPVRAALRLGAYQLAFSEVAVHAAVNESVELVRAAGLPRAVGFTNAIMRRLTLGLRDLVSALRDDTPAAAALKHSYPDWVAELWWRELGSEDALALMEAQNEPAETVVRLNRRKAGRVEGQSDSEIPDALHVERVDEAALRAGLIWPQSRGSQLAGLCVASREGERVLDLCAAPGGKATQLAGEVTAVELHPGRARQLEENCARLGATNVRVVNADALALPEELRDFDRVLVDAPCSGLGVLASRPDLRWRAKPLPDLQLALLRVAAERVRPGGTILYSVCTISAEENEAVVEASGLEVESLREEWPQFAHPRRPEFLLTLPHRERTSGFFIARMNRPHRQSRHGLSWSASQASALKRPHRQSRHGLSWSASQASALKRPHRQSRHGLSWSASQASALGSRA